LDALVDFGANVNFLVGGLSPLHIAASAGNTECVLWLLTKALANPNYATPAGITPVMMAAKFSHVGVIIELMRHRAKVNCVDVCLITLFYLYTYPPSSLPLRFTSISLHYVNAFFITGFSPLFALCPAVSCCRALGCLHYIMLLHVARQRCADFYFALAQIEI
jgi:ankyrin repeat protein